MEMYCLIIWILLLSSIWHHADVVRDSLSFHWISVVRKTIRLLKRMKFCTVICPADLNAIDQNVYASQNMIANRHY